MHYEKNIFIIYFNSCVSLLRGNYQTRENQKKLTIKDNNVKQLYKEEIQNAGINDIGKILEQYVSEINSIRKGGIFNDIVLRGFYRDNINVLVDNSKIFGVCPNRMDPPISKVSSVEIEKIEVQKGSFDVENQGSLAGTINIKTVEPSKDKKININLTVGSFSYFKGSTLISGGNDKASLLLVYEKSYSKPYKTGEGKKLQNINIQNLKMTINLMK